MLSEFALFDPETLVRRRVGMIAAGARPRTAWRPRGLAMRSLGLNARALSMIVGAGLAVTALGAFRVPVPDPARLALLSGVPMATAEAPLAGRILHTD